MPGRVRAFTAQLALISTYRISISQSCVSRSMISSTCCSRLLNHSGLVADAFKGAEFLRDLPPLGNLLLDIGVGTRLGYAYCSRGVYRD